MKYRDGDAHRDWLQLHAKAGTEPYRDILQFSERLADALEKDMRTSGFEENIFWNGTYNEHLHEIERAEGVELSARDVGEVLVLLGNYWQHGELLLSYLTHIEQKIVAENVEYRLSVLASEAQTKELENEPGTQNVQ